MGAHHAKFKQQFAQTVPALSHAQIERIRDRPVSRVRLPRHTDGSRPEIIPRERICEWRFFRSHRDEYGRLCDSTIGIRSEYVALFYRITGLDPQSRRARVVPGQLLAEDRRSMARFVIPYCWTKYTWFTA